MKTTQHILTLARLLSVFFTEGLHAQGTAFTYQGRLNDGGSPANGSYDLTFTLFGVNAGGVAIAGPVTNSAVALSNGLFTTTVGLGNVFTGASNWLTGTFKPKHPPKSDKTGSSTPAPAH